ncbi:MAG: tetratricopeptide repeat protein [Cardiobacteriaceae bacterium]|nr:tetratricopeptide repeat protein [Cardiobacteriaceae bacterium]
MADWLIILLLPLAAWSGWWVAMRKEARDLRADKTRAAYFEGVGFLLNDQTDRAVDVFIHMADLDQQMLDNQLTLGSLFRKRGELDRALHLHQQLRNHSQLTDAQSMAVDYELAEDYAAAGMYTQAQMLFEALLQEQYRMQSVMPALASLYERTKQWQPAIALSTQWSEKGYGARGKEISHYYCELAQEALEKDAVEDAAAYLQQALGADRDCVRANRMRGQLFLRRGEFVNAIHALQSIGDQSAILLPDVLTDIARAYHEIGRSDEFRDWLVHVEAQEKNPRLTLALAQLLAETSTEEAADLLQVRMEEKKTPLLLSAYLSYRAVYAPLSMSAGKLVQPRTVYQCNECGFRHQHLIWHCPACFAWSSFRPLIELKVENR